MRKFIPIWFGQVVSGFGSALGGFALGVWVYNRTGSVTQFGLIVFWGSLPGLLLSPISGALVDRWDRRRTMIVSDLVAALGTVTIALLLYFDRLEIWYIYILVAIMTTAGTFQRPALSTSIPLLVPRAQLGRAAGMGQAGSAFSEIAAPMLAGFLLLSIDLEGVMLLDFATFLLGILPLLFISIPRPAQSAEGAAVRGSLLKEAKLGWTYIARRPGLLGLLLVTAITNVSLGMVLVLLPPLVLSFGSPAVLGTVQSVASIGLLVGAVGVSVLGSPKRRVATILGLLVFRGLMFVVGGLQESPVLITAAAFLFLCSNPIINTANQVLWQTKVPVDLQGRVMATRSLVGSAMLPLAYLLGGPLADRIFEPLLAADGALAGSVGQVIGVGPGRGVAFLLIVLGSFAILVTLLATRFPALRNVERDLPDVELRAASPEAPPASGREESVDPAPLRAGAEGT
ncbi:MAG TPA: MFS transporter [Thermoanaerobaculia bacterium]|nr:MFS transporter [Thermoanaerobaculia bacterium]